MLKKKGGGFKLDWAECYGGKGGLWGSEGVSWTNPRHSAESLRTARDLADTALPAAALQPTEQ